MRSSFEEFFNRLGALEKLEYLSHPTDEALSAYRHGALPAKAQLSDARLEKLLAGELEGWSGSEMAAHLLTCARCAQKLADWDPSEPHRRDPEPARSGGWLAKLTDFVPALLQRRAAFYAHAGTWALAGLLIALSLLHLPPFAPKPADLVTLAPGRPDETFKLPQAPIIKQMERMPQQTMRDLREERTTPATNPYWLWLIPLLVWGLLVGFHGLWAFRRRRAGP